MPFPPELGQLGQLRSLDLRSNGLTGTIPPTLGRLGQLEWLHLDHNRLTCAIPPELGQLGHLRELGLGNNLLTGSIPTSLEPLLQVRALNLTGNRLTNATAPEPEQLNPPVVLPISGIYTDQAEHWGGWYRALREGRQVTATLAVHRSHGGARSTSAAAVPAARGLPAVVASDLDDGGPVDDCTGLVLAGGPGSDR